ncbi:unnamed protein product [Anisakis simplex]|uniref:DUF3452 domain-containing protein n=1 Tax=Anisakis simplex TaxID=6269 RepID=A0A0M3JBJ6_ANISI|nr:unnamed protein product [Anisakis simplex]
MPKKLLRAYVVDWEKWIELSMTPEIADFFKGFLIAAELWSYGLDCSGRFEPEGTVGDRLVSRQPELHIRWYLLLLFILLLLLLLLLLSLLSYCYQQLASNFTVVSDILDLFIISLSDLSDQRDLLKRTIKCYVTFL